jgi:hypothetical protein
MSKSTGDDDGQCYTSTWAIVCYCLIGFFFLLALGLLIFGNKSNKVSLELSPLSTPLSTSLSPPLSTASSL